MSLSSMRMPKVVWAGLLALCVVCALVSCRTLLSPVIAAQSPASSSLVLYVVPAVTDDRILPDSALSPSLISDRIVITAAPGEYEPASFVLRAKEAISGLRVESTGLVSPSGSLPADVLDIRVVKCWYQLGDSKFKEGIRVLTPELLLKDDSLVKVEGGENHLKVNGEYLWISSPDGTIPGIPWMPTPEQFPVRDAATLQPVDIPAGTNKQFWVTAHVPADAASGVYNGRIEIIAGQTPVGGIDVRLRVLPFTLAEPMLMYSMYYDGQLRAGGEGSISSRWKTEEQLRAEFKNLREHGVTHPVVSQSPDDAELLRRYLNIMKESGMATDSLFLSGDSGVASANLGAGITSDESELVELEKKAKGVIEIARSEGFSGVYFSGVDEALAQHGVDALTSQRPAWEAIHRAGGKVFDAGVPMNFYRDERQPGNFGFAGDIQDLLNCNGVPSAEEAARWHSMGHKIFCYSNPQAGVERPETYRRNYGLLLWQVDYDGAMPYAYQVGRVGNIWNDWRSPNQTIRNRAMAYPTADGVIDTLQWEGWREGVDDIRYLTTLLESVGMAKAQGRNTADAEAFISWLKACDLSRESLNAIRKEIIGHILALQGAAIDLDIRAPSISSVGCSLYLSSPLKAVVRWATDEPARGCVEYGKGLAMGSATPPETGFTTQHEVEISGLDDGAIYYYRIVATDSSGNRSASTVLQFTMPASGPGTNEGLLPAAMSSAGGGVGSLGGMGDPFAEDRSIVGWWTFDAEGNLRDRSAYGNDIVVNRGTAFATENEFGGARAFTDGNGILKCWNSDSLSPRDALTIEMWVKGEGGARDFPRLIEKDASYYVGWRLTGGGYRCPFFVIYSGGKAFYRYFGTALPANSFTHLVAVYDSSTGRIDCYTNGVWDNGATDGLPPPGSHIDASESELRIGSSFIGAIHGVRIWDRALSAAEVRALYAVREVLELPPEVVSPGTGEELHTASNDGGSRQSVEVPSGMSPEPEEYIASVSLPSAPAATGAGSAGQSVPSGSVASNVGSNPQTPKTFGGSSSYIASTAMSPMLARTSVEAIGTPAPSEAIAWSPYESPQNPGDLGIYLMGKGELDTGAQAPVELQVLGPPESSGEPAAPVLATAGEEDDLWTFIQYVGYLVASVAAAGALILWVFQTQVGR